MSKQHFIQNILDASYVQTSVLNAEATMVSKTKSFMSHSFYYSQRDLIVH